MARRRRLAAGARQKYEIFPAFVGRGEWNRPERLPGSVGAGGAIRKRNVKHGGSRGGETRPVRLRSERRGAHDWRAAVLPGAADGDRTARSAGGRGARWTGGVQPA